MFFPKWSASWLRHNRIVHLCRGRAAVDINVRRFGLDARHSTLSGTGFTPTLRRRFHDLRESRLSAISS
jgi:hypothetical protein